MNLIDNLIQQYSAPEKEFVVTLPQGEEFRFRAISDYSELQKLKAAAARFAEDALDEKKTPMWSSIRPGNKEAALACFFIQETLLEPKLTQADVMKLARHAGWLVEHLFSEINSRQMQQVVSAEEAQLEDLGNGSSATDFDETA